MIYTTINTKDREYKLTLTTAGICQLEKKIGCNPLTIFGNGEVLPTITTMVAVLHQSLQKYQHNINEQEACNIFDEWLECGNAYTDFVEVILEIYKVSGLIKADDEKN